jgi:hypothetical protein
MVRMGINCFEGDIEVNYYVRSPAERCTINRVKKEITGELLVSLGEV